MEILIKILQFIFAFSLIVIVHEFGHYIAARWCGCKVEKFYLFFNPWFSLYKKKVGDTEYGIGWIPFGGYVKIAGMIDESMDKSFMNKPPESWEFRSKNGWQKLFIMLNGIILNMILGIIIYIGILWSNGESYQPATHLPLGIAVTDSVAYEAGFRDGDQLLRINGTEPKKFRDAVVKMLVSTPCSVEIQRGKDILILLMPNNFTKQVMAKSAISFIQPRMPLPIIDSIFPKSIAQKIGLQKNDKIYVINKDTLMYAHQLTQVIRAHKGKEINMTILRDGEYIHFNNVYMDSNRLGIELNMAFLNTLIVEKKYSFFQAIPAGVIEGFETITNYAAQLKLIVLGKVNIKESVGGPITITKMFPTHWDWLKIWVLTAFFSIAIGLMNLLPIPGLDGGHALFALYEIITGKAPSQKIMEVLGIIGFVFIIGLMILTIGLDIWRLFK